MINEIVFLYLCSSIFSFCIAALYCPCFWKWRRRSLRDVLSYFLDCMQGGPFIRNRRIPYLRIFWNSIMRLANTKLGFSVFHIAGCSSLLSLKYIGVSFKLLFVIVTGAVICIYPAIMHTKLSTICFSYVALCYSIFHIYTSLLLKLFNIIYCRIVYITLLNIFCADSYLHK